MMFWTLIRAFKKASKPSEIILKISLIFAHISDYLFAQLNEVIRGRAAIT